jgi:two-component system, OmpR family, phosphate regulon sensor histidine kinase PhoR
MMYVAKPVYLDNNIIGVIRSSLSVSSIETTLNKFYRNVAISGFLITLLATIISVLVFRRITIPIRELEESAKQFAEGNLQSKLPVSDIEELATLATSMNRMAEQLDSRFRTIIEQRNEREAIFSSMTEGVIALDAKDRIAAINQAVVDFLGIDKESAIKKSIYEVVRIAELHEFVGKTVKSSEKVEMEFMVPGKEMRYFQAHGTALLDSTGTRIGVLLVFSDITRLKKLENVRREFVANVSHELKTPITSIIGSAETLLVNTPEKPDDIKRFLTIIANNSDRLNSLVDDLLTLARLESETEQRAIQLNSDKLHSVLETAVNACQINSKLKNIKIELKCDPYLEANYNAHQLEQAVINLIDNAIKYSEPDTAIFVNVIAFSDEIVISVEDQGGGIESTHLPRLFERFYRIDKARTRDVGGTGLGLAIVKHVALAHGGKVSVDSEIGKGSKFRIHLPSLNSTLE